MELFPALSHPTVAVHMVNKVAGLLSPEHRKHLIDKGLLSLPRFPREGSIVTQARILGPLGSYPNIKIDFGSTRYLPYHGIPLLVSSYTHTDEGESEVGYLNEQELIAAASVLLADERPGFYFYFEDGNSVMVATEALESLSPNQRNDLLFELLSMKLSPVEPRSYFQPPNSSLSPYLFEFQPFQYLNLALSIHGVCDPSDQLLLRTLYYLQNSRMLWCNGVFSQDAIANVFFALEGCLLLLQRKYNGSPSKIDLKLLASLFAEHFRGGEELFEFVQEAYEKRIQIVHPSPASGPDWRPFLMADDFYEYFQIARELLNLILVDRKIDLEY